eukprot:GFKZ01006188.1.p1 GENE.GFKZ01006188.1~~GFKZ01006188.1.p1  ORF type:complete len:102 (-),score=0.86 GFKZ01006188.1:123-428(-)
MEETPQNEYHLQRTLLTAWVRLIARALGCGRGRSRGPQRGVASGGVAVAVAWDWAGGVDGTDALERLGRGGWASGTSLDGKGGVACWGGSGSGCGNGVGGE